MLGGDVFEDDERLVVRLEVPGMEKEDFAIEVAGRRLVGLAARSASSARAPKGAGGCCNAPTAVSGGVVPLPVPVLADEAGATYRNGVLKIELPKAARGEPAKLTIRVE
ncbi:MAG: Hsp20/alpha crystallin family protein [Comamonadaceae bacterium]|nr:Hsp20/alpha crystallin family protein [Comamonadaceae bacterium]